MKASDAGAREEIEQVGEELKGLLHRQGVALEALIAAVSDETDGGVDARKNHSRRDSEERIQRLLRGELLDTTDLAYDFGAQHLGVIASGSAAMQLLSGLSAALECRLLTVARGDDTVWAWFGSRDKIDPAELGRHTPSAISASVPSPAEVVLAVGEPSEGLDGWRLTHQQARAALPIAVRGSEPMVRYGDVALLASILQDDLLSASLRELYLDPLTEERDGGYAALETLHAYMSAERNISSAAAALGVNRNTVANRLRGIEKRIGRPLASCGLELETALRLDALSTHQT